MNQQNKEIIEDLFNKNYGWLELEQLSRDIIKWIEKDKKRFYSQ